MICLEQQSVQLLCAIEPYLYLAFSALVAGRRAKKCTNTKIKFATAENTPPFMEHFAAYPTASAVCHFQFLKEPGDKVVVCCV